MKILLWNTIATMHQVLGSILEIVTRNDYKLDKFAGQKNKIFIDIGANLGIATIIMAKLNPESIVYSFEPIKNVYDMLVNNININSLTNVKTFNMGVSDRKTKSLKLSVLNNMSGASSTYANENLFKNKWSELFENRANYQFNIVDCVSLDEFITTNGITEIELLKIDCEGAEFDIIYDSELFKERIIKNLVGEFHNLCYNNALNKSQELIEYCKKYIDGIVKVSILNL